MKIILIGNYPLDGQQSMDRFANMLNSGFNDLGNESLIWKPPVFFGAFFNSTTSGLSKWFGYFDKWILFPIILKIRTSKKEYKNISVRFHICDHSNSPYLNSLPKSRTAITCHDVLAIRGAFGHKDAYCEASKFGKILQKWILSNLCKAEYLASVSNFTLLQLKELCVNPKYLKKKWIVIHNSFNAHFESMSKTQCAPLLEKIGLSERIPFILHVGSSLPRKNRELLLKMVSCLENNWNGVICFAGDPIDNQLIKLAKDLKLSKRMVSVVKPNHNELVALYSSCEAFVFPSYSEGFGWPLIEAQACGTPVIASNLQPMPEVSGGSAIHVHPDNAQGFADAFINLRNNKLRKEIIDSGFRNIEKFQTSNILNQYLSLHQMK